MNNRFVSNWFLHYYGFSTYSSIVYYSHTTTRLQFILHWFSLEMIHTSFQPVSPTNPIPTLHLTLSKTRREFSEIHSNSLFNRTTHSTIQYPQCEINHYPKTFLYLSFSPSPFQNNQMNRYNSYTTHRNCKRSLIFHSECNERMSISLLPKCLPPML